MLEIHNLVHVSGLTELRLADLLYPNHGYFPPSTHDEQQSLSATDDTSCTRRLESTLEIGR